MMTDEELKALVERLTVAGIGQILGGVLCEHGLPDAAASAIRQLMRERDEAREVIADLSRANLERSQSPF
jgi:hypothetical protein